MSFVQSPQAYRLNQLQHRIRSADPGELVSLLLSESAVLIGRTIEQVKQGDVSGGRRTAEKARRIVQEGLRDALRLDSEVAMILDTQYALTLADLDNLLQPGRLMRAKRRMDSLIETWEQVRQAAKTPAAA